MTFNWKSKRFDNFILMLNDKFIPMSKYSSNNILSLQFSSNKVGESIDFDSAMGINFSDEGNFSFRNRQREIPFGIDICVKAKTIRQMSERFPYLIFEYAGEPCAIFFFSKHSMGLPVMMIQKESFAGFSKGTNSWAIMSLKHPILPERVEALDRGVSSRLSLWNKNHMNSKKHMQSNKLRYTELISSSTDSRHLVVHLGYPRNAQISPSFNKMQANRKGLFICTLTCKSCMATHINCVEGVETNDPVWPSEMPGTHKICLLQISHLLSLNVWIRLIAAISFWLFFPRLAMTKEYSGYSGNRRNVLEPSSFELPVNGLWPNSSECRSASLMRFKFFSDSENFINHVLWSASADSLWSTAFVPETIKTLLPISTKPLGKPAFGSLNSLQYFIKANVFIVQLYCFMAYIIFTMVLHRLFLPPKRFGRSLGDVTISSRCYDIFKVHDVMSATI